MSTDEETIFPDKDQLEPFPDPNPDQVEIPDTEDVDTETTEEEEQEADEERPPETRIHPPRPAPLAKRDPPKLPASDDPEMQRIARLGMWLAASEVSNPTPQQQGAAAALRIYLAGELGLPITAAAELSFIKGRLNVGAHLQRYLAWQSGLRVVKEDSSDESCTAVLVDRYTGEEIGRATFTIEQARRRGSIREGSGYTKNPDRMLWARATTEVLKDHAPHVAFTLGIVDEYDAKDMAADEEPVAQVA